MELEDFEPANEFEFDLSDVDVAAFESVATEDTTANSTQDPQQQKQQQEQTIKTSDERPVTSLSPTPLQLHQSHQQTSPPPASPSLNQQSQQQSQQQQPQQLQLPQHQTQLQLTQQQQHVTNQFSQSTGAPAGKILLVPINSKPGQQGFKHFLQLPAGASPIAMGTIPASGGNKKQIIQLAPLSASSLNMGKNNYSYQLTTASQIPGSSQGQKQQQLFITMNNSSSSPAKQTLSLNSVLNKSLNSLQNNSNSIPNAQFSTGNLTSSRNLSYNDSLRASTPNSTNVANEVPKRKPCNCTKSQCLKLYCDCFANGEFCSGCNCTNCFNSLSKEKERQKAISQCLERNPEAFRPKIGKAVKSSVGEPAPESIERRHTKGCNCKRSGCLKNYCECYEAKILCSNLCKCCGCKNYDESFERKSLMQAANSASENARGILKNLLPTNTNHHFCTGKESNEKCFIDDRVIQSSLASLLEAAEQAEKAGTPESDILNLLQNEMGKCLRMIVDSATESSSTKKR